MQRHRVAILINDMNYAGGIQRVAANLAKDLGQRHEVIVLSVVALNDPVFQEPGMTYESLNCIRESKSRRSLLKELCLAGIALRRFVRTNKIDTVLAIWYDYASVAALALPRSVKKIGCEHMDHSEATRTWHMIRRFTYPRLDATVGLTQESRLPLEKISRSVHVIPNAIRETTSSSEQDREKLLLTAGHIILRKGIDRLLWALKAPLTDNPDWKLVIVGGGERGHADRPYMRYLSALIHLLKLEKSVEFHPATLDIETWYRRASIYVMGSRQEGLPMVLLEAKAHGLPIVCFNCPTGPKDIVRHEVDGYLIQNSSQEFGEAANAIMTDQALWQRMSKAALQDAEERFSAETVTQQWLDLIDLVHQETNAKGMNPKTKEHQNTAS